MKERLRRLELLKAKTFDVRWCAEVWGCSTQKARRRLLRSGACRKDGRLWITSYALLERAEPEMARLVLSGILDGDFEE